MTNNFHDSDRADFRGRLDFLLHPSRHIELSNQLKGRERAFKDMQDAFETSGTHPFVWGVRGIGKTSLAHSACEKFSDQVVLTSSVACTKSITFRELIDDILADTMSRNPGFLKDKSLTGSISAFGFTFSGSVAGIKSDQSHLTVNQAASLLDSVYGTRNYPYKIPVIIVDEVDRLENPEVFQAIADLLKQLSVQSAKVKVCLCGITTDLGEFVEAHESVDRYLYGIELRPLPQDAIWSIVKDVELAFNFHFGKGQALRIGQISAGYPHFAHLILKNTLLAAFEEDVSDCHVSQEIFRFGLHQSASQAAARLRTAYENAVRKGTDRYIEVLFAVANSEHFNRQFKDIASDYERIMRGRPNRSGYDVNKNNGKDLRNALNSLSGRGFLQKGATGWYQFQDPMLRSYVRLVAETEGVVLSDEAFPR